MTAIRTRAQGSSEPVRESLTVGSPVEFGYGRSRSRAAGTPP